MEKSKSQQKIDKALTDIDSIMTALNTYPNIEDGILDKAQEQINKVMGKMFPTQLDFAKDILEHLVGTDVLIEILSDFLVNYLPYVEVAIKAALLANMNNLGSNCTIDPIIREKAIKEGVVFDLRQIDLYDKLTVSPLDKKIGQYYYFGTEDCESSYDILMSAIDPNNEPSSRGTKTKEGTSYLNRAMNDSVGHYFGGRKRDFDCLLWYMKNKSATRQVWGKRTSASEGIFNGNGDIQGWIDKKGSKRSVYYEIQDDNKTIKFYTKDGSKLEKPSADGKMIPMIEGNTYTFCRASNRFSSYKYGNAPYSKISRHKVYVRNISEANYEGYYYDKKDSSWKLLQNCFQGPYVKFESIPDNVKKKGNFVIIDKSVYKITGVNGVVLKYDECIDVTEGLKTSIYVDYKQDDGGQTKGDKIKADGVVESTFKTWDNVGEKQWVKTKDESASQEVNVEGENCYFYDKDGDGEYTEGIDKILIPPHDKEKGGEYVNINDKMANNNKYTKDFGVLTLEYSPRTGNLLQSDGNPLSQQTPYDNAIHIFYGNVKELPDTKRSEAEANWQESSDVNKTIQTVMSDIEAMLDTNHYQFNCLQKKDKRIAKRNANKPKNQQESRADDSTFIAYHTADTFYKLLLGNNVQEYQYETSLGVDEDFYDDISKLTEKITEIQKAIEPYKNKYVTVKRNDTTYTFLIGGIYKDNGDLSVMDISEYDSFEQNLKKVILNKEGKKYYSISAYANRIASIMDANESMVYLLAKDMSYPEAEKNYYFKHTLFEFNADYINSLQLFDSKVLAAQLITSLFGSMTMSLMLGATASWKTELIRDVVKEMVEKTIAAEDFAVSDCFFTFTNDAYNGMLRAADLRQAGLYSRRGEENGNNTIDPTKILESLNGIDDSADQAGQIEIIKGAIMTAAGEVSKDVYNNKDYLSINSNFGINMSFIETLMINLCTQLVMAVLSPKVYLLILINLEMFGLTTNYNIKSFIQNFQNLIRSIVKSIVDQFMQWLTEKIKKILEPLCIKFKLEVELEQVEYYARLIKQILQHLRLLTKCGETLGWTQDEVTSADIVSSEDTQEIINEC